MYEEDSNKDTKEAQSLKKSQKNSYQKAKAKSKENYPKTTYSRRFKPS